MEAVSGSSVEQTTNPTVNKLHIRGSAGLGATFFLGFLLTLINITKKKLDLFSQPAAYSCETPSPCRIRVSGSV
ncbi:hypothetical protein HPP92_026263 [Vanilla planifolia]|uniref:Uncharacterized protein n=1 Tax=Vanilla planifolia TaxID=51239 RepID=A0A835PHC8_VANPL|nr:hypothetical protein HPP92_026263 [Vanilla planifolia]